MIADCGKNYSNKMSNAIYSSKGDLMVISNSTIDFIFTILNYRSPGENASKFIGECVISMLL